VPVAVSAVPGAPAAPKVYNILSTSCTVRYQLPADDGDAPVTGYHLERREVTSGGEGEWEPVNQTVNQPVNQTDLELVVEHLKPRSRYQFRVAAENRFGVGEYGQPSQFTNTDNSVGGVKPQYQIEMNKNILDRTYSARRFFIFSFVLSFYFGSCGRLSWLNCQLSSAR